VQRTSAGTQGVSSATHATRLWCASLVCAGATADAVNRAALGAPTYVITGRVQDGRDSGEDDLACAEYIEGLRTGKPVSVDEVVRRIQRSDAADRTRRLGAGHVDPDDIAMATRADQFDFAMEVRRTATGLCLERPLQKIEHLV